MDPRPRFGANYVPPGDWMHTWLDLDADAVRRDLDGIADLGMDHVRVMPLWPVLQPNRTLIRQRALDDVRLVVDIAAERGLDASVDVIQGHLSSFDFVPAWLASWHARNMFTDRAAIDAQVALVEALGARLEDAANLLGLTLGNELNQFSDAPHPSPMPCTVDEARAWLETLLAAADRSLPGRANLHSEYDAVWYLDGHSFVPSHAARLGAMTTVHSWIFNGTAQRHGGRSTASDRHAEYLIEVARAFAVDDGRRTWLQEVGAPSNCMTDDEMPGFLEATVRHACSTRGLWGVTWWCSHDVSRSLSDFPDLEHTLGLLDEDRKPKPLGMAFARVAKEMRAGHTTPAPRTVAIVLEVDDDDVPLDRTAMSPGGAVFERWVELCDAGVDPCFVTSAVADDALALAARGVLETTTPARTAGRVRRYDSVNTVVRE